MKKMMVIASAIVLFTLTIQSDVYLKGTLHVEGSYRWGQIVPENNAVYEWWFSNDKVTMIITGWRLQFLNTDRRLTLHGTMLLVCITMF